jgi:magnesium transporter
MITIDDVVDIIREEQTEDAYKQVGAGAGEAVYSTVRKKVRGRMPWLVVNLGTASLAASVVLAFTDMIELVPVAAILFPIVANQAGNTGFQSLAVTLRGITLKEIHKERVSPLVMREAISGGMMGLGVGILLCIGVIGLGAMGRSMESVLLSGFSWRIGVVAGVAMTVAMFASALIGTLIPILMEKIGADPATASSIFLVTFTDSLSFAAFLGLIFLFQTWIQEGPPIEDVISILSL